jgi:hypothetical protein
LIRQALTTNLRRARIPGNVLLEEGEADLPEQSVVVVSQLFTVDKEDLLDKIGSLSGQHPASRSAGRRTDDLSVRPAGQGSHGLPAPGPGVHHADEAGRRGMKNARGKTRQQNIKSWSLVHVMVTAPMGAANQSEGHPF